jgi:trans-2,3-dihydro-3-hydroxyanthranilate isomerase
VFGEHKFSGNQLAVVLESNRLTDIQRQKIANEMHFSETIFIKSGKLVKGSYNVQIYTPKTEIPFAGHPILGSAFIIRNFMTKNRPEIIFLNLQIGQIEVSIEKKGKEEVYWLKQPPVKFERVFTIGFFEQLLSLKESDFDTRYPIQEVTAGLPFVIVPLKSIESLKRAKVNCSFFEESFSGINSGILVFCRQTHLKNNDLSARVFVDILGIPEDPATGSANGCLAAYLKEHNFFGNPDFEIKVEQGFEINRPSLIYLRSNTEQDIIQIGGNVFLVAKGEFL